MWLFVIWVVLVHFSVPEVFSSHLHHTSTWWTAEEWPGSPRSEVLAISTPSSGESPAVPCGSTSNPAETLEGCLGFWALSSEMPHLITVVTFV